MVLAQGYNWYAKYIAEAASQTLLVRNSTSHHPSQPLEVHKSVEGGHVLVIESRFAPIVLALLTLVATIVIPILFTRIMKVLAVVWCGWHNKSSKSITSPIERKPNAAFHLPVFLANCGLWTTDAWTAANLSWQSARYGNIGTLFLYLTLTTLCIFGLLTGPAMAFVLSHHVETGFGGTLGGICTTPMNFSLGAINAVSLGEEHHGRAIELLPWLGSFSYFWSNTTVATYNSGQILIDPLSGVSYSQLDHCLLEDEALCDSEFNRTHMVTANLTSAQLGLWAGGTYNISMEASCIKMNSTTLAHRVESSTSEPYWEYGFYFVPGATNLTAAAPQYIFGQGETERFASKKNVVTDSWFMGNLGDKNFEWALEVFPPSLRALDIDSFTVLTILPSTGAVNQQPGDEIYLPPVSPADFNFAPDQLAHLLCWESTFLSTPHNRTRLTSSRQNEGLTQILQENALPTLLSPLLSFVSGEFVLKPARYLRANTLLQSVAGDTVGEYSSSDAPSVPFGAEMHRWGHVGILDIASKATRMASGYYARGNTLNSSILTTLHENLDLLNLCSAVREARAGVISIPVRDIIVLLVLLTLACSSWTVETVLVTLAQRGWQGVVRLWLVLPAAKPTSLNASVMLAMNNESEVKNSASGWPIVILRGREQYFGPIMQTDENERARLRWGFGGLQELSRKMSVD